MFFFRVKLIKDSLKNNKTRDDDAKMTFLHCFNEAKETLRIPITSPSVYQPMLLITWALCVQHLSGFTYTRKFLLQVLQSERIMKETNSNSTREFLQVEAIDQNAYFFAIIIHLIRFVSNLIMARFLQIFRVRFLYFNSLISTSCCLFFLGFLEEEKIFSVRFSFVQNQYLKMVTLVIHVFCVQFGLQSLAGQLTDILLPSSSKAVLKGAVRGIQAFTLLIFILIIKQMKDQCIFWLMALGLILVSPLLYIGVPELKNLGRSAGDYFFSPSQTIFYVVLPLNRRNWSQNIMDSSTESKQLVDVENQGINKTKVIKLINHEINMENYNITIFHDTIYEIQNNGLLKGANNERINFITNILGQNGFLYQNINNNRLCFGRGPILFSSGHLKKGAIFLFNDVVLLARQLVENRRYCDEMVFVYSDNFDIVRNESTLTLKSRKFPNGVKIFLETVDSACIWEKYCKFCQEINNE